MTFGSSEYLQLAIRIPINRETQGMSLTSRFHQTPKWYQFIPRCLLARPWLKGLLPDENEYNLARKALIVSDEGGVGKTKAGAISINHAHTQQPQKPILLLVPKRLIIGWRTELLRINNNLSHLIYASESSANHLKNLTPGKIYIVSKDSFSKNAEGIFTSWNENDLYDKDIFSLVVIDEAHKGKAEGKPSSDQEPESNIAGTRMYRAISKLCKEYSEKSLAITASPLSMKLNDIRHIGTLIGVDDTYLQNIPSNLNDEEETNFLERWAEYIKEFDKISAGLYEQNLTDDSINDLHEFFADVENDLVDLLPHSDEIREIFSHEILDGWRNYDTRIGWLNELNPIAPFLSIIKRQDLGESANQVFRERNTWTEFVQLHPKHNERIEEQENQQSIGTEMRMMHEWPTNKNSEGIFGSYSQDTDFHEQNGDGTFLEPRLQTIMEKILPRDPVISGASEGRKGALIFCGYKRTVRTLQKLLDKYILEINGQQIKIRAHEITGEHPDAMTLLNSLGDPESQAENEYNIVIGTSAIQEGISMNWASTVIHWDLPPNPQTLEQRTWRLDRHRTEKDSYMFNVVYLVTNSASDSTLVTRIRKRAELSDTILGHTHKPNFWPIPFDENSTSSNNVIRVYEGEQNQFFYEEALQLAEAWNLQADVESREYFIRTQQQKILFHQLFNLYGLPLLEESLFEHGSLEFDEWGNDSIKSMQNLMHLADGSDLGTLQKCYPSPVGARKNFLRIDGFQHLQHHEGGRRFAVSLNPEGTLLMRIMRRFSSSKSYVVGPTDESGLIVFSIEREKKLEEFRYDFVSLLSNCFSDSSRLFVIKIDSSDGANAEPLVYSESNISLLMNMLSADDISNTVQNDNDSLVTQVCSQFITSVVEKFKSEMDLVESQLDDAEEKIRDFDIMDSIGERILQNLKRRSSNLDKRIKQLEETSQLIQSNREGYFPVIRYIQGGI